MLARWYDPTDISQRAISNVRQNICGLEVYVVDPHRTQTLAAGGLTRLANVIDRVWSGPDRTGLRSVVTPGDCRWQYVGERTVLKAGIDVLVLVTGRRNHL